MISREDRRILSNLQAAFHVVSSQSEGEKKDAAIEVYNALDRMLKATFAHDALHHGSQGNTNQ